MLAPLADFAQVRRASTITAWIMGHGLALLVAPTSVVVVGGLAIATVGSDKYLRFGVSAVLLLPARLVRKQTPRAGGSRRGAQTVATQPVPILTR